LRLHRNLAIIAALLVVTHTAGFLLLDNLLIEYLLPTTPVYMLVGIIAFLALLAVTVSSLPGPRRKFYGGFNQFRRWHRALFIVVLAGSLWHTIGTDYTLGNTAQIVVVAVAAGLLPALAYFGRRQERAIPRTAQPASDMAADLQAWLGGATIVLLSFSYALIKEFLCATC
jgi:DMSO/TMAO reductase YedYZ heme-binding membrane subunit